MMGRVTLHEGQVAAKIVSGVSGVQKVVTLFDFISEDEYKRLNQTVAQQPNTAK